MSSIRDNDWLHVFASEEMMTFLREFNYIKEKYGIDPYDKNYAYAAEIEGKSISIQLSSKSPSRIKESINQVYGNSKKVDEFVLLYRLVTNEIIHKYLNIPGIERLYDEHFFEMEWDMHSRMNFEKHEISFYRDHFVHQVRNLFEIYTLLKNQKIYQHINNILSNSGISKISYYISGIVDHLVTMRKNRPAELEFFKSIHEDIANDETLLCNALGEHYMRYIIFASSMLACLYHDIGYPIEHFVNLRARISEYLPILYMFINGDSGGFDRIRSVLCESLLFTVVPATEIKKRLFDKDHGAISAIAFLLQLYETGGIYSLPLEKKAAVELAGLTIYNHTIKYYFVSPKDEKAQDYYRTILMQNPISYMLRLCDDLQEWERVYFEIQNVPAIIMCHKCKTPLIRVEKRYDNNDRICDSAYEDSLYEYECRCDGNNEGNGFFKNEEFNSREIITVYACNRMYMDTREDCLKFYLDYDQYKLLILSKINPTFAKYRIKELNFIKRMVWGQDFGEYKNCVINFAISANPLVIKRNIVGQLVGTIIKAAEFNEINLSELKDKIVNSKNNNNYIYIQLKRELFNNLNNDDYELFLNKIINFAEYFNDKSKQMNNITMGNTVDNTIETIMNELKAVLDITNKMTEVEYIISFFTGGMNGEILKHSVYNFFFYLAMWLIHEMSKNAPVFRTSDYSTNEEFRTIHQKCERIIGKLIRKLIEYIWKSSTTCRDNLFDETMCELFDDLTKQTIKAQNIDRFPHKSISYYEEYMKSDDSLYMAVNKYCDESYISNIIDRNNTPFYCIDYNTDLYVYRQINLFNELLKMWTYRSYERHKRLNKENDTA